MSSCCSTEKPVTSPSLLSRMDRIWLLIPAIALLIALLDPPSALPVIEGALESFIRTLPFLAFAVLSVAWMKASGVDSLMARAFEGREGRMILLAAAMGAVVPFCSCEVIPFVAALLALGAPVAAVIAFLLSAPLMDPAMFFITAGTLGTGFAAMKLAAAIAIGIGGGFLFRALSKTALLKDPLRLKPASSAAPACAAPTCAASAPAPAASEEESHGCGCSAPALPGTTEKPLPAFWREASRRRVFRAQLIENALFLGKWLLLAFLLEQLVTRYVPEAWIASTLGGEGLGPILLATIVGGPAYINGYAAIPLVKSLIEQGMSNGAAMAFVIAGGVSCVPTAVAIWGMVKPRVFLIYVSVATIGAVLAGLLWQAIA